MLFGSNMKVVEGKCANDSSERSGGPHSHIQSLHIFFSFSSNSSERTNFGIGIVM